MADSNSWECLPALRFLGGSGEGVEGRGQTCRRWTNGASGRGVLVVVVDPGVEEIL